MECAGSKLAVSMQASGYKTRDTDKERISSQTDISTTANGKTTRGMV